MAYILPLLLIAAMYALVMRPQQRRVRAHAALMAQVRVGDEIVTAGGVFGRVVGMDDETMRVEIAPGVEVTMLRRMVMDRVVDPADMDVDVDTDVEVDEHDDSENSGPG